MEKWILRGCLYIGIGLLPAVLFKRPVKMWLATFSFIGGISSIIDWWLTMGGRLLYPVRFMKHWTSTHLLVNVLIFPIICLHFIQTTLYATPATTLRRALFISLPFTAFEWVLEKKTRLIQWRRWSPAHTFFSVMFFLITARGIISRLNPFLKTKVPK